MGCHNINIVPPQKVTLYYLHDISGASILYVLENPVVGHPVLEHPVLYTLSCMPCVVYPVLYALCWGGMCCSLPCIGTPYFVFVVT